MAMQQRIVRIRREYNQWVANQTLEDYALRFTARSARKWSAARVANTALGGISFLALEAIGATVTMSYGFTNAVVAILLVSVLIFAAGVPISYYAARDGVDIDLLTRGAGFGYIGSTITSLIYASFTFIFFAIEAAILASMLEVCLGIPPPVGYVICAVAVIPLVTHGITFISRVQLWSQPVWLLLQLVPFIVVGVTVRDAFTHWTGYAGSAPGADGSFQLLLFGSAASVVFSLIAQIGEQVDYLRFLPSPRPGQSKAGWWASMLAGGPGWIVIGMLKLLGGSFLACVAVADGLAPQFAAQPTVMYQVAFGYVVHSPVAALALTGCFVVVSQVKINITNAYAGSIAWSNFFSRLTHSHPGRVVWLIFNIAIALLLMELGIYQAIEHTLVVYSVIAAAWVGALVADLVINKPLGFSPAYIEFKRAHLYDINPVGTGAMLLAVMVALAAYGGAFGIMAQALSPFLAFMSAFAIAPLIAWATGGHYYIARKPRAHWAKLSSIRCVICENEFEPDDMAYCPAYTGAICSLCCSLDARCHDSCKPSARLCQQVSEPLMALVPPSLKQALTGSLARYFATLAVFILIVGALLLVIYSQTVSGDPAERAAMAHAFWQAFLILIPVAAVSAWLLVLAQESRRVAQEETQRQTALLMAEIRAHQRTDRQLQKAKDVAEAANLAKSRYVVGISHELRSPLNAILGYAQLLERDTAISAQRRDHIRIIRRSGEHLAGLIEGLLDISKIEAGRIEIYRDEVRLSEFLHQLVNMFRLQAEAKGIAFSFIRPERLPEVVYTDERRLRQILINLLSNAIKFTNAGSVHLRLRWRSEIAEFEIADTGIGIDEADLVRIFEPFERVEGARAPITPGIGLGLTITRLLTQIMGGELTVTSQPNQGSRFSVRLMLSEALQALKPAPLETRVLGYKGERLTVLVADDDPVHRGLLEDLLAPLGFIIFMAADGAECLALAEQCRPDLLLVDISMPTLNGWQVARQLRENGFDQLVIVVISANPNELHRPPQPERYHDDVLAKPVSIPDLLNKISFLLQLEWLAQGAEPRSELIVPIDNTLDPTHTRELRQLGSIGYIRGIHARLDSIETEEPGGVAYIAQLRRLVSDFQIDAFMEALGPERDDE
jgi:signal transduction histidine kinase/CheY-like chemotaxis protein/purine-cytosine permease-like protein